MSLLCLANPVKPTGLARAGSGPDLAGLKSVVVGLGRTGEAMVEFLLARGAKVTATDVLPAEELGPSAAALADKGAGLELGGHRDQTFTGADLIVVSPGVPLSIEPLKKARAKGVRVTGEMELASLYVRAPLVGVTGTNGKTTVTSLIGEIMRASGTDVFVGGNIGSPLIECVNRGLDPEVIVLEVSSFQLDTARTLAPRIAVLLNVTPDHLDRYPDFKSYASSKARIFARQGPDDAAILNADDPLAAAAEVKAGRLTFSRKGRVENGAFARSGRIVVMEGGGEIGELPLDELALTGAHNHENVMAALLAARVFGIDFETARRAAAGFGGLPHRLEKVGELAGVSYYDDSKGTNVGAVMKSLEGFTAPVILIAGGLDKAGDFAPLKPLVGQKVKLLILLGQAKEKMAEALGGRTRTVLAYDMAEAVALARKEAKSGDVVLLSPACASFDMFRDYAHRGRVFTRLVKGEAA